MENFAIQHGPTPLCTWNIDSGSASFHPRATRRDDVLVLRETDKFAFVLNPAPAGVQHRVFIGDVPLSDLVSSLEDAGGVALGGQLFWRELAYFESARGRTRIVLEAQPSDTNEEAWVAVFAVEVYVIPSKIGEERYQSMVGEIEELSRSLLTDLYGKSSQTNDLRHSNEAKAFHAWEQELESIEVVLDRLGVVLTEIGHRPASTHKSVSRPKRYWGDERISPATSSWLARRGASFSPARGPVTIQHFTRIESFDIPEHRVIRAFLDILARRAGFCAEVARCHIHAITSEQHLRHVRLGEGPTIYESVDLPKIRRLQEAGRKASRSVTLATAMKSFFYLRDVRPELVAVRGGTFQRSMEYRTVFRLIRHFLLANAVWYQGDQFSTVTKLTSRLFEQWCFLQLVEAFRSTGLEIREWNDALRQNLRSRFILDFDRGLMFEGALGPNLRLRIRYEPWILSKESAIRAGETLCRGSSGDVAWCPDVVIECLRRTGSEWIPAYGIVLDCKYTARIQSEQLNATEKYLSIRSVHEMRQVIRQLWLIALGDRPDIVSEDPAISFGETGASCPPDERVRFRLIVSPRTEQGESEIEETDQFAKFARGTIGFLRREFGTTEFRDDEV